MKSPSWSFPYNEYKKLRKTRLSEKNSQIPIGGMQSYGDSNFRVGGESISASGGVMILDSETEILEVSANKSIFDVLNYLLEFKRTLPVVPGTPLASIGGCLASDIHGKGTFKSGSFSASVVSFTLQKDNKNSWITRSDVEIWRSTVGGQGLTGLISKIRIRVVPLASTLLESRIFVTRGIRANLEQLRLTAREYDFSVSWISGNRNGDAFGFVQGANELHFSDRLVKIRLKKMIPSFAPRLLVINRMTVKIYNQMVKKSVLSSLKSPKIINRWDFTFPNKNWGNWNYAFGAKGFHEVQFYCPFENIELAANLLERVIENKVVFLIGIKVMSGKPEGYLSFPEEGFSIAVNFPAGTGSRKFVQEIYEELTYVLNSRIYLTKDWVLTSEHFKVMYPEWEKLKEFRRENNLTGEIKSGFSDRVQLDL